MFTSVWIIPISEVEPVFSVKSCLSSIKLHLGLLIVEKNISFSLMFIALDLYGDASPTFW